MSVEDAGRNLAYRLAAEGPDSELRLGRRLVVPRVQLERLLVGGDESETNP